MSADLLSDALHVLNGRERGRTDRMARLEAAGVPTESSALRCWYAAALRDEQQADGCWFYGDSARGGGDADLPRIGRYFARIAVTKPEAYQIAAANEDGEANEDAGLWRYRNSRGSTGGNFDTEAEAIAALEANMERDGWTRDWRVARDRAIAHAESRVAAKKVR